MAIKRIELWSPISCLNKAGVDEPIFVLRAKDLVAAMTVRHWATMAVGIHEEQKIREALDLASKMEQWRAINVPTIDQEQPS